MKIQLFRAAFPPFLFYPLECFPSLAVCGLNLLPQEEASPSISDTQGEEGRSLGSVHFSPHFPREKWLHPQRGRGGRGTVVPPSPLPYAVTAFLPRVYCTYMTVTLRGKSPYSVHNTPLKRKCKCFPPGQKSTSFPHLIAKSPPSLGMVVKFGRKGNKWGSAELPDSQEREKRRRQFFSFRSSRQKFGLTNCRGGTRPFARLTYCTNTCREGGRGDKKGGGAAGSPVF